MKGREEDEEEDDERYGGGGRGPIPLSVSTVGFRHLALKDRSAAPRFAQATTPLQPP